MNILDSIVSLSVLQYIIIFTAIIIFWGGPKVIKGIHIRRRGISHEQYEQEINYNSIAPFSSSYSNSEKLAVIFCYITTFALFVVATNVGN